MREELPGLRPAVAMENGGNGEMTRSVLTLVMFATVSISAVTQSTAPDTVDEPRSGTPFPLSLTPPGGTTPHWLMGTAIRKRTLFRVQIYAFGLYVDPEGARASLSRFAGVSAPRLEDDESFYRHLLDLDFDMTLRLVMTRTVDGDDVAEAFDEALRPRLVRAVTDTIGADELAALDRFCTAPGFLDSGLTVFASTLPRPARRGRVAPGRGFDSRISPASTVRCMSA